MKPLILSLLLCTTLARAAEVEAIPSFEDQGLEILRSTFAEATRNRGETLAARIKSRGTKENNEEIIATFIDDARDYWSKPDSITVRPTTDAAAAIKHALSYVHSPAGAESAAGLLSSKVSSGYELFTSSDRNSFGGCASMIVLSKRTSEFLILESCWAE